MREWTDCQGNAIIIQYRISGEGHVLPHVSFNKPGGTAVSSLSASHISIACRLVLLQKEVL